MARVVGRDASRSTAQVADLYVALCEDETVYGLFKTMKGMPSLCHAFYSIAFEASMLIQASPRSPRTDRASV